MDETKSVAIIGCGLVGSLAAHYMARRNFRVLIYEKRADFRRNLKVEGKSINLAMSHRGRSALKALDLEKDILDVGIPMRGRLIHHTDGRLQSILYDGVKNECLYSLSRNYLNVELIKRLECYDNVHFEFGYNFVTVTDSRKVEFVVENVESKERIHHTCNFLIGADGSHSAVRHSIPQLTFSQTYIEHAYLELHINAHRGVEMVPNYLHIWPRGHFMMIALPNADRTWTVTLFMPWTHFYTLDGGESVLRFFHANFSDFMRFVSDDELTASFFAKKPSPLVSIKCDRYHSHRVLLMGDAAHAMVPFFGQGMNCGFEDCELLGKLLQEHDDDIAQTCAAFSLQRVRDAHAICELSFYNYVEMRDLVRKPTYLLRKHIDEFLYALLPNVWIPLYNLVTFTSCSYSKCVENRKWQDGVLVSTFFGIIVMVIGVIVYFS